MNVWSADKTIYEIVEKVKNKWHLPRLQNAGIAVSIKEAKAFIRNRFNLGNTSKFSPTTKVHLPEDKSYDFLITLPSDSWNILSMSQKEALIDLRICCMQVEYEPEITEENGKKKPVKDEWGRQVYTDVIKVDVDGNPKWKLIGVDFHVIQDNVSRYGCWYQDLTDLKSAINSEHLSKSEVKIEEIENV